MSILLPLTAMHTSPAADILHEDEIESTVRLVDHLANDEEGGEGEAIILVPTSVRRKWRRSAIMAYQKRCYGSIDGDDETSMMCEEGRCMLSVASFTSVFVLQPITDI